MTVDSRFIAALRAELEPGDVLTSREECVAYECDALTAHRRSPDVVALPRSVDQVQAVMRLAQLHQVPVVARGAGTGLSGGALPVDGAVLLVLARLDRIMEFEAERRIARVQPGATNLSITQAHAPHGLFYAPDPSSQVA